jgi:hypothetical protein
VACSPPEHLRPLLEHVAPVADDRLRAEIEAEVLRWVAARAARKTITVPGQLGERVLRVVTRRNARDAAQRAVKALRNRVCLESVRGEGLAGLAVVGTVHGRRDRLRRQPGRRPVGWPPGD